MRTLGNSDLELSSIGFGAWGLGGGNWQYSLGPQDDNESIRAIHCALDAGINWIDTAAIYGLGHSEEVVARAVKTAPNKPYIFTKCSKRWRKDRSIYSSLTAASLTEEVEASLRRLGAETIDLLQVHHPEPEDEIEEGWGTLARLREQGKIRWIGVSNFSVRQIRRAQKIAPITSLQPQYSMLRRSVESEILPFAQDNDIGVINYSAMGEGLLTGGVDREFVEAMAPDDCRRTKRQFHEPRLSRILQLVDLLREIGSAHGVGPGVVAVAWTLHNPAVSATIVGLRSVKEVKELTPALHFWLTQDEYDRIGGFLSSIQWYLSLILGRVAPSSGQVA